MIRGEIYAQYWSDLVAKELRFILHHQRSVQRQLYRTRRRTERDDLFLEVVYRLIFAVEVSPCFTVRVLQVQT
jgi:hypothetical protein